MNMKTGAIVGVIILLAAVAGGFVYINYSSGTLTVKMMDPPAGWGQASNIFIHYSAIEVHRTDAGNQSGWATVVEKDGWIDMLTAINVNKTIGQSRLQPGHYNIIRFEILEAKVTVGGQNKTATVASGKLNIPITRGGITLNAGQTSELVIDVNPTVTGSETAGFRLAPAVRAIPA